MSPTSHAAGHFSAVRGGAKEAGATALSRTCVGIGFAWGSLTSFSFAFGAEEAAFVQASGLLASLVGLMLLRASAAPALFWLKSAVGILLAVHGLAAVASGLLSDARIEAVFRYVALVPAMSIFVYAALGGHGCSDGLRLGLTAAGVVFVLYHLAALDQGLVFDPNYRVSLFLNTNGVGFVAAMTAVSLIGYASGGLRKALLPLGLAALCVLLCVATKSRTASLAGAAGAVAHWVLASRGHARNVITGAILAAVLIAGGTLTSTGDRAWETVSGMYKLSDEHRSIQSGTNRYAVWAFVASLVAERPLFGVGPGEHGRYVSAEMGQSSAHNGLLANMAEVGIIGTTPLIVILILAFRRGLRSSGGRAALPLIVVGVIESAAETMFFSLGNSASLLFLLGIANASVRRSGPTTHLGFNGDRPT